MPLWLVAALRWVGHSYPLLCRHVSCPWRECNVRPSSPLLTHCIPPYTSDLPPLLQYNTCCSLHLFAYSAVALAWTQILNGFGGGISVVCTNVMVQASVPHEDMGIVISNLALWTKLFGAISTAVGECLSFPFLTLHSFPRPLLFVHNKY